MSAGIVDVHYSVERWANATWGEDYAIAYEGAPFRTDGLAEWIHLQIIGPAGVPSRALAYGATVRVSIRVFNRTSQRNARIAAQDLESDLRCEKLPVYDEQNRTEILGYLNLHDPSYTPLPRDPGGVHGGVLDVNGTVELDLTT